MSFFADTRGDSYPVSRVRRIVESHEIEGPGKSRVHNVELDEGERVQVYREVSEQIKIALSPTVSALPGTFLLEFDRGFDDQAEPYVTRLPIVAWATGFNNAACPVVLDCEFDGVNGNTAYLMPDGKVYRWAGGDSWDGVDAWIEYMKVAYADLDAAKARIVQDK